MGTLLKIIVIALAMVGMCVLFTHYTPSAWTSGWELPGVKLHVSWAVTTLLAFLTFGVVKFKFA